VSHPETLPALLFAQARRAPGRVALREKRFGVWRAVRWAEYAERVRDLALALAELGVGGGDCVAFVFDNRPEWLYTELAAQLLGAVALGIYPDNEDLREIHYLLELAGAKVVLCESQEQADKIRAVRARLPRVAAVAVREFHEVAHYEDAGLLDLSAVMARGAALAGAAPTFVDDALAALKPDGIAMFSSTSGTTGRPKIAMLTHRGLLSMARAWDEVDPTSADFEYVSFLPTAWIGERMLGLVRSLYGGFTVDFPERPETAWRDLREIGPHIIFSPPRVWEKMLTDVQVRIGDSTPLKRWVFRRILPVAERVALRRLERHRPTLGDRGLARVVDALVTRKIRDHLGLSRLRYLYTGGAAIGVDLFRFFLALGVPMKQAYGLTESGAIATIHRTDGIKLETVGRPFPGLEVRISDEGEILVAGPTLFAGYHRMPEATATVLRDGWLHTGDKGYLDEDGELVMIDRMGDVMRLRGGQEFSPQFIENALRFSPYIKEAVVFGHEQPYVGALVQVEFDTVGKWAEKRSIAFTTFRDLSEKPEVVELIEGEIETANARLPRIARVQKFVLLDRQLDPDNEELTQTQKLKRQRIAERYAAQIDRLYDTAGRAVRDAAASAAVQT
jgi:long-chain acyl-CoA synthetase